MKERPILFSALMVRAILECRKTMTRRVIRNPHLTSANELDEYFGGGTLESYDVVFYDNPKSSVRLAFNCPYGRPGDRLWVKESWAVEAKFNHLPPSKLPGFAAVHYLADGPKPEGFGRTRSSRFMPRWASRLTLDVVSVREERLQDISEADAEAEGIEWGPFWEVGDSFVTDFRELWNSINGEKHPWSANDWVWVVEFRQVAQ